MVHCSQVSDELSLSRDDEDDAKVKAMEFFCPPASEVRHCIMLAILHLLTWDSYHLLVMAGLGEGDRNQGRRRGRLQGCLQHEGMLHIVRLPYRCLGPN